MNAKEKPDSGSDPSSGLKKQKINCEQHTTVDRFHQLLRQAGHRPTKDVRKWICGECPAGKSPALTVGLDVFYCHRCGTGGNLFTLGKSLGLLKQRQWNKREKHLYALKQEWIDLELQSFLNWLQPLRREYVLKFRDALDQEAKDCRLAKAKLEEGVPVDPITMQAAIEASVDKDIFWGFLDFLDCKESRQRIYEIWRSRYAA